MNPQKTGKNFWGPPEWASMHSKAAAFDGSAEQKKYFKQYIISLTYILPCGECRQHLKANLEAIKIDDYFTNNHSLFLWTYLLHNTVNTQLGKKSPPFDVVKRYYFRNMGSDCATCTL
jgi:hypothetical protein